MRFWYRSRVGEAIFSILTARPDVAHAVRRLSQHDMCPHRMHYAVMCHLLKYLFTIQEDSILYWWSKPREDLPAVAPPRINNNMHDLMMDM